MKKFTLKSSYTVMRNGLTEVTLVPSDLQIERYISNYTVYNTEAEAIANLDALIAEQTPKMFHVFHYSDSIPAEIRDQYEL